VAGATQIDGWRMGLGADLPSSAAPPRDIPPRVVERRSALWAGGGPGLRQACGRNPSHRLPSLPGERPGPGSAPPWQSGPPRSHGSRGVRTSAGSVAASADQSAPRRAAALCGSGVRSCVFPRTPGILRKGDTEMKTRDIDTHGRTSGDGRPVPASLRRRVISRLTRPFRWAGVPDAPSAEEARRRIEGFPTLLSTVTAEQLAAFDAFEGTEFVGGREPRIREK
jgi:hypothetical protein